ncbi:MAG: hypothetical protein WCN88_00865 [Candidatus Falkowbacteria bacterium]
MLYHGDDKYLVPFPEFFQGHELDIEVYLSIKLEYQGWPIVLNIIFTKSEDLEEIKFMAKKYWEEVQSLDLPNDLKLAVKKVSEKLNNEMPIKPRILLKFKQGPTGYRFNEDKEIVTIFIDKETLPQPEKIIFFPSDFFNDFNRLTIKGLETTCK